MAEKVERKVSPIGEAKWAHVHQPKSAFKDPKTGVVKGDPKYEIDVVFEKGGGWSGLCQNIISQYKADNYPRYPQGGKYIESDYGPIKTEVNDQGETTGRFYISFKTGEKFPPRVFDKYGQIISPEVLIGNGSKVKVAYKENHYPGFGGGINLYLNAVQVVELVEYSGGNATDYGFETEENTDNPFDEPRQEPDGGPGERPIEIPDDEIPF